MILDKALTLTLAQFEDSELYDKLNRARQEASIRPLSLVNRTFALAQNADLARRATRACCSRSRRGPSRSSSPRVCRRSSPRRGSRASASARFSGAAPTAACWRISRSCWRARITRKRSSCSSSAARLLARYREIFRRIYAEEKRLTIRRDGWGFVLGLVSSAAFYGAYAWIALATIDGTISLGEMTMYLLLFKQGQSAVAAMLGAVGGMYEDNLYLSNLYDYLEQPSGGALGRRDERRRAARRHRVRQRDVHLSRRHRARAARRHAARAARPERRARRLERLRQDDAREAARGPLRADARARSATRAATCASGTRSRCASASA